MKSNFSVLHAARNLLFVKELTEELTGQIYKISRPLKSQLEDVVINCLTINGEYLQSGYVNVNIYVRDLQSGLVDTKRLEVLSEIAIKLLDNKKSASHDILTAIKGKDQSLLGNVSYVFFEIASPGAVLKDQDQESTHFINIKLKFNTL
ncbi:hypothetical protein [Flavicella sp.]|uniref:hypothetical protein n=1 Tax=Flavicella sp. TaxID=2957742 RepID=UPI00301A5B8B